MKLIDLTCSKCGAQLKVNADLKKCMCQYCGNEMLIDDEVIHHKIDNAYQAGYQAEVGRIKAQEDYKKYQNNIAQQQMQIAQEQMTMNWIYSHIIMAINLFVMIAVTKNIGDPAYCIFVSFFMALVASFIDIADLLKRDVSILTVLVLYCIPVILVPYIAIKTTKIYSGLSYGLLIGAIIGFFMR